MRWNPLPSCPPILPRVLAPATLRVLRSLRSLRPSPRNSRAGREGRRPRRWRSRTLQGLVWGAPAPEARGRRVGPALAVLEKANSKRGQSPRQRAGPPRTRERHLPHHRRPSAPPRPRVPKARCCRCARVKKEDTTTGHRVPEGEHPEGWNKGDRHDRHCKRYRFLNCNGLREHGSVRRRP